MLQKFLLILSLSFSFLLEAKLPEITPAETTQKIQEMMKGHASYKVLTPFLVKRILTNYLEELDPNKSYFIEPDIHQWLEPSEDLVTLTLVGMQQGNFKTFDEIYTALGTAVLRRRALEKTIDLSNLPKHVNAEEFKDMKWVVNVSELKERLMRIKALQQEAAAKLSEQVRAKTFQRIEKRQRIFEDEILERDSPPTPETHSFKRA